MNELDAVYLERNQVVAALAKFFPSGVKQTAIEGWDPAWHNCVYIDLPTGQASWHFHESQAYLFDGLPVYAGEWDGHDTPEKYRRLAALQDRRSLTINHTLVARLRDERNGELGQAAADEIERLRAALSPSSGNEG